MRYFNKTHEKNANMPGYAHPSLNLFPKLPHEFWYEFDKDSTVNLILFRIHQTQPIF